MMLMVALAPLAAGMLLAGAAEGEEAANGVRTELRQVALAPGAKLWVRNLNGSITVTGWDREELVLTAEIRDSESRPVELSLQRLGADLAIAAMAPRRRWPLALGAAPSPRCRMQLNVPRQLSGHFRSTNGPIMVESVVGFVRCEATNGDISLVRLAGEILAETRNGNITGTDLHARLRAETANGSIHLENVDGQVQAETAHGAIWARNLDGWGEGIRLESADGPIEVELGRASGMIFAESEGSPVRVRVAGGQVLEEGRQRMRVRLPGRNQRILVRSAKGSINVH